MPLAPSRRRCLQCAALLPLSGCATPDSRSLDSVHGALSTDGQRVQLVLRVEENRRVTRLLAHHDHTQVLSRRVLALELPAQPAVFQTTELLRRARLLAGPDPELGWGHYSVWQGYALLGQRGQGFRWCQLQPGTECTPLGRAPRQGWTVMGGEERWVQGTEGRYLLTQDLLVDVSQPEPLLRAWAARPGYAAFADALQAHEPLPSLRRGPAGQPYVLQLLQGRWLLALLQDLQPSHRHWGYGYDLRDDRMTALPRVPRQEPDGPCTRVNVREAALGAHGWQLWLQHPDCAAGRVVHEVLDLPSDQRWPIQGATRVRVNGALAKAWDAAGRRLLLEQERSEVLQLPERLVLHALAY